MALRSWEGAAKKCWNCCCAELLCRSCTWPGHTVGLWAGAALGLKPLLVWFVGPFPPLHRNLSDPSCSVGMLFALQSCWDEDYFESSPHCLAAFPCCAAPHLLFPQPRCLSLELCLLPAPQCQKGIPTISPGSLQGWQLSALTVHSLTAACGSSGCKGRRAEPRWGWVPLHESLRCLSAHSPQWPHGHVLRWCGSHRADGDTATTSV